MPFSIESRPLGDAAVLVPSVFEDQRGFFLEAFRADQFAALGLPDHFPQDNHSRSSKGVLRGLHFQWDPPMAKLMRVTVGVGVSWSRSTSARARQPWASGLAWRSQHRIARQVFAPAGFARGFCVLSDFAELQYKCTGIYNPKAESGIRWDDPQSASSGRSQIPSFRPRMPKHKHLKEWLAGDHCCHFQY